MRLLIALALLAAGCAASPEPADEAPVEGDLLSTYYPAPQDVVERMLDLGGLAPRQIHIDLGSGDGRIVVAAAQRGAESIGYEIDDDLVKLSRHKLERLQLTARAQILRRDMLDADFSRADLITVFLTPEALERLAWPLRHELRHGARIVAYKFPLPGWTPVETVAFEDDDSTTPTHELYLYRQL